MDFFKAVSRDVFIFAVPFLLARVFLYPIVNINNKLQRQYCKIEEEANIGEKYQKYKNFTIAEKIKCAKEIIATSGYKGLYEKCENYLLPFLATRLVEGYIYFSTMRFCLDILKMNDPLYLLTGLVLFFVDLAGAFCLKYVGDVVRDRKDLKSSISLLSPSNMTFWRQYEVELGYYHTFGLIQGYFQMITFWYLKPGFVFELLLFFCSRMLAVISTQPLNLLARWAVEHDFDHVKVFKQIIKKDGKLGLLAGAKDCIPNEIIFSVTLISGFHILARLV